MGAAALVFGIFALLAAIGGGAVSFGWLGCILGILAIIFGAVGKKNNPSGTATAGLVLGIISVIYGGIATVACLTCLSACAAAGSGAGLW